MKAIRVHAYGDSSRLVYEEVPEPQPAADEIRVKVEAAGLNFVEIYHRSGLIQQPLPFIPGSEFSGVVDAVGSGGRPSGNRVWRLRLCRVCRDAGR